MNRHLVAIVSMLSAISCTNAPKNSSSVKDAEMAEATRFQCNNVGGKLEWTVTIDLAKKQASFFDNENTVDIPMVKTNSLESLPTQIAYDFFGDDTHAAAGTKIRIAFNATKLTASVVLHAGEATEERLNAEDGCVALSNEEDSL